MRKIIISILTIFLLCGVSFSADARGGFLVKGGLGYTSVDLSGVKAAENYTNFHFGVGFNAPLPLGLAIQPELVYKHNKIDDLGVANIAEVDWEVGYLQLPVNIQWGIDLIALRPYIFVSPFIGYNLVNDVDVDAKILSKEVDLSDVFEKNMNKFEYGVGLGAGVEVWKLQVAAKYVWNFGDLTNFDKNTVVDDLKGLNLENAGGFEVSVGIVF